MIINTIKSWCWGDKLYIIPYIKIILDLVTLHNGWPEIKADFMSGLDILHLLSYPFIILLLFQKQEARNTGDTCHRPCHFLLSNTVFCCNSWPHLNGAVEIICKATQKTFSHRLYNYWIKGFVIIQGLSERYPDPSGHLILGKICFAQCLDLF